MYGEDDEGEAIISDSEDDIMDASMMTLKYEKRSENSSETSSEEESDQPTQFQAKKKAQMKQGVLSLQHIVTSCDEKLEKVR